MSTGTEIARSHLGPNNEVIDCGERWRTVTDWPLCLNRLQELPTTGAFAVRDTEVVLLGVVRALTATEDGARLKRIAASVGYLLVGTLHSLMVLENAGFVERTYP